MTIAGTWLIEESNHPAAEVGAEAEVRTFGGEPWLVVRSGVEARAVMRIVGSSEAGGSAELLGPEAARVVARRLASGPPASEVERLARAAPPSIVRSYTARNQDDAVRLFKHEAAEFGRLGYVPTGQSWADGSWNAGAFLVAVILFVFLILFVLHILFVFLTGLLVLLFLLMVKPDGTLTVTYTRAHDAPSAALETPSTLTGRLQQLEDARAAGLLSDAEFAAKRESILEGF